MSPLPAVFAQKPVRQYNFPTAENTNHVLKYELKPLGELTPAEIMATYNADTARLDNQAVETILFWLKSQV